MPDKKVPLKNPERDRMEQLYLQVKQHYRRAQIRYLEVPAISAGYLISRVETLETVLHLFDDVYHREGWVHD